MTATAVPPLVGLVVALAAQTAMMPAWMVLSVVFAASGSPVRAWCCSRWASRWVFPRFF